MIKAAAAALAAAAVLPLLIILLVTAGPVPAPAKAPATAGPVGDATAAARADIPPLYLIWYMDAAQSCPGLPWSVLAGVGTVESDNGQSDLPGVHSGANFAGAEGPMQFEPSTFAEFAAGPDRPLSPYDPADAIYTAAAMLCANGARGGTGTGIENAVFAYNHADWYVGEVMSWASKYAAQGVGNADIAPAAHQRQQDGPVVPPSQTKPGELLFSGGTLANPGHVAMYLGRGQLIRAPQTRQDAQTGPLDLAGVVVTTRPAGLATTS